MLNRLAFRLPLVLLLVLGILGGMAVVASDGAAFVPPITNLRTVSYATDYITWMWTTPVDENLSHMVVYPDDIHGMDVSTPTGSGEADINIINVQSYPTVGGNWTVRFTTEGTADLTIKAVNGTEFDVDLEFLELRCGDNVLTTELTNGVVFVENYACDGIGYETSKVLKAGKHTLEFRFGDDVEYAYNQADWWNASYPYRRAINTSESAGLARTEEPFWVNITGLTGIDNCVDDTRIVSNWTGTPAEIPSQFLDGDNSTWCYFVFLGNVSASASNEEKYYVYYGYDAGDPGYTDPMTSDYVSGTTGYWEFDNGLISWYYDWDGGRGSGPGRTWMTTPLGTTLTGTGTYGPPDSTAATDNTFISLTFEVDGPIYKRARLIAEDASVVVRNQTIDIYAKQNWYETEFATFPHVITGEDYQLAQVDPSTTGYYDGNAGTTTTNPYTVTEYAWVEDSGNSGKGTGFTNPTGVDDQPFNNNEIKFYSGTVFGWYLNDDESSDITEGYPFHYFTIDNGDTGANNTYTKLVNLIDKTQTSVGSQETASDTTPPASITNLQKVAAGTTWINWSWTNPSDGDFNHTMVYINGTWQTNVSNTSSWYNASGLGLGVNTSNEISTRTVDTSGNVNTTWVNMTSWTLADVPTDLVANMINTTAINVSWSENSNPSGTYYEVFRNGSSIYTGTATYKLDTGLDPSTTYGYWVRAKNGANIWTANTSEVSNTTLGYGWLNVTLIDPDPSTCNESSPCDKTQNSTFWVNATVSCEGGDICGIVNGTSRHNTTAASDDYYEVDSVADEYITNGTEVSGTWNDTRDYDSSYRVIDETGGGGADWWNDSWQKRKEINITNVGSSELTDFPAYLNVSKESGMQSDYDDLRFTNDSCGGTDTTELDYEIESYTGSAADVWIRIPSLGTGTTSICMYYNNSGASSGQDVAGTWDSNYVMVQHMVGSAYTALDDSTGGNDVTSEGGNPTYDQTGKINSAVDFDGDDYVAVSDKVSLDLSGDTTVETWIKSNAASEHDKGVIAKSGAGGVDDGEYGFIIYTNQIQPIHNGLRTTTLTGSTNVTIDQAWHHIVVVYNSTGTYIFVDGNLDGSSGSYTTPLDTNDYDLVMGIYYSTGYGFNGAVDEVRLSNTRRTPDWINQSYQMVENQDTYVDFGSEEAGGGAGDSTLNVTYVIDDIAAGFDNYYLNVSGNSSAENFSVYADGNFVGNITSADQNISLDVTSFVGDGELDVKFNDTNQTDDTVNDTLGINWIEVWGHTGGTEEMTAINTTTDTPFYTTDSQPQSCGSLIQDQSCQLN